MNQQLRLIDLPNDLREEVMWGHGNMVTVCLSAGRLLAMRVSVDVVAAWYKRFQITSDC